MQLLRKREYPDSAIWTPVLWFHFSKIPVSDCGLFHGETFPSLFIAWPNIRMILRNKPIIFWNVNSTGYFQTPTLIHSIRIRIEIVHRRFECNGLPGQG